MNIQTQLKKGRLQQKLLQNELADKVGVSRVMINYYERGTKEPSTETLKKLCEILKLDYTELLLLKSKPTFKKGIILSDLSEAIRNITWMARRYAEGRQTYAPDMFNESYRVLVKCIDFDDENDPDRINGVIKNFPYATEGGAE